MKISKTNVLQVVIASLSGLVGAVGGFVVAAPLGAYSGIQIGLVRGYEVTGGIGGSIGMLITVVAAIWIVATFSKVSGSLVYSIAFGSIGAVLMCIGVLWLVPVLGTPLMVLITAVLATIGWQCTPKQRWIE